MRGFGVAVVALWVTMLAETSASQQPQQKAPPADGFGDLRPLTDADKLPPFSMDYFVGRWSFEWDVPDGVLGSAGTIAGSETFKKVADGYYVSEIQATGPDGPLTGHSTQTWGADGKFAARYETTKNGIATLMAGRIGAEGQQYAIYYESAPFTLNGKTIRLKKTITLTSPASFRVNTRISVEGGPYENYGNPWFRKDVTSLPKR
jgi:hypothetical protein